MNFHNSKTITLVGIGVTAVASLVGQFAALSAVGHLVVLALGIGGAVVAGLGKGLLQPGAPA